MTCDTTARQGERRVQFLIDPNDVIAESDETDNKAVALVTIAPPPGPNLVMKEDNINFTPSSPTAGTEVTIEAATVLNEGMLDAGSVDVQFFDVTNGSPQAIGSPQTITGIPAGGSGFAEVAYDTTGKEGDRIILVVVDADNVVAETDETDNEADHTLTVLPEQEEPAEMPNLTVTTGGISFDPPAPTPGDMVTVTAAVSNTGESDASVVVVRFLDATDDEPVQIGEDQTIPGIVAGEAATVTVPYDTTDLSGDRTITVVVDPDDAIDESDETDNEASATLPLGEDGEAQTPRPNLVVTPAANGAVSMQDGVLTVAVWVKNEGRADAQDVSIGIAASPDGSVIPLDAPAGAPLLGAGEQIRVEARYGADAGPGLYSFEISADPDDVIREAREDDNVIQAKIELP